MTQPHWTNSAENLCRDVAGRDLEGHAVYIVEWSEVAADFPDLHRPQSAAWTSYVLDLTLEPWLRRQGRWQGSGFATIVHRDRIASWRETLAACLHELAHWLSFDGQSVDRSTDAQRQSLVAQLLTWCTTPEPPNSPPWLGHEASFVRASAHLAHRAEQVMESIRPSHLRFSSPYFPGISEGTWMATLEPELDQATPIRDILQTEPPEAFNELWAMATDWWEERL